MAEKNNKQKIKTKQDLSFGDLRIHAAYEVEKFFDGEMMLKKEDYHRGVDIIKNETIESIISTIDIFLELNRNVNPIEVESQQDILLPDGTKIRYVMDVEIENGIIDYKFTGKKKTQRAVDEDSGLTIYALAYFAKNSKMPEIIQFNNFVSYHTQKKRELKSDGIILNSTRTVKDFEIILDRINMAIKSIKSDVFLPAPVGAWNCSPDWCGYFSTCKYVNYERICAAEAQEQE